MKGDLAKQLLDKIREKSENVLDFINCIEPRLLEIAPKRKESYYNKKKGVVIFEKDSDSDAEPIEVLKQASVVAGDIKKEKSEPLFASQTKKQEKFLTEEEFIKKEGQKTKKIEEVREEIEEKAKESKEKQELDKRKFIEENLSFVLRGGQITGEHPYSFPMESYKIKTKGIFRKKYIVIDNRKSTEEFQTLKEAENFMRVKKEEKAKIDLEKVWEIIKGKRISFYE